MTKAMTGVEITRTKKRVLDVINNSLETVNAGAGLRTRAQFRHRNSARLQPLYRINGATVDAHLEVKRGCAGRRRTHAAKLIASLHPLPSLDRGCGQVTIERVLVGPMIDDDQRTVTD